MGPGGGGGSKIYNMNILVNRTSRRLIFPTMCIGTLNKRAVSRVYQRWQQSWRPCQHKNSATGRFIHTCMQTYIYTRARTHTHTILFLVQTEWKQYLQWTTYFVLVIKPTRCTNFSNLFLESNSTCFGQFLFPPSGVFHCTHSSGICHIGLLCVQWKNSWWWTEELSETCRVLFQK